MKPFLIALAAAGVFATSVPAEARPPSPPPAAQAPGDTYTNVDGHQVHRPVHAASRPAGASARCRDGSYSFSEHQRGTCSHHGGVASWY